MSLELEYNKNFNAAWDELKNKVRDQIDEMNCIDANNNIKWPCKVYIIKREKERAGLY